MKLDVLERLMLRQMLPPEGSLVTMRIVRELRRDLGFTAEEIAKWNLKDDAAGQITWGWTAEELKADPSKAIDFTAEIDTAGAKLGVIVEALKAVEKAGKVNDQNFSLFEKFPTEQA
jgi:hypothetical protein